MSCSVIFFFGGLSSFGFHQIITGLIVEVVFEPGMFEHLRFCFNGFR